MKNLNVPEGLTKTRPIRDIIFDYLREAIVEGDLKPGSRLIERDLAEKFEASRTPVREALRKLEVEGFLERKGRRGDVVRSVNQREMEEAYLLRMHLEPLMVQECIKRITPEVKEELTDVLEKAKELELQENSEKISEHLLNFDSLLMASCELPKLRNILNGLQEDLSRFRRFNLSHKERRMEALKEHQEICKAILEDNSELAAELTHKHISNSFEELKKELNRKHK